MANQSYGWDSDTTPIDDKSFADLDDDTGLTEEDGPAAMDAMGIIAISMPLISMASYMFLAWNLDTPSAKVMVYVQ